MTRPPTTRKLFEDWQDGDADAGQKMAQRFSDWYYAIAVSRLGERTYREPVERACRRFAEGITSVSNATVLVDWAHNIIAEEMRNSGERLSRGDQANAVTNQRRPSELLVQACARLSKEDRELLSHAYDHTYPIERVQTEAEAMGGYPLAVLRARYALKQILKQELQVRFSEVPEKPRLDLAPLPLYEAGRMQSVNEESAFEKWTLSDISLCRDLAEFATFALALRSGALKEAEKPATPEPVQPSGEISGGGGGVPPIAYVALGLLVIALIAVAALMFG